MLACGACRWPPPPLKARTRSSIFITGGLPLPLGPLLLSAAAMCLGDMGRWSGRWGFGIEVCDGANCPRGCEYSGIIRRGGPDRARCPGSIVAISQTPVLLVAMSRSQL